MNWITYKYHKAGCTVAVMAVLMAMVSWVHAQEQPSLRDRAEAQFRRFDYAHAVSMYLALVDVKQPDIRDLRKLAECYRLMNNYEAAENWYARVIGQQDRTADDILRYGEVLKANGRYAEAKKQLEVYAGETGDREGVALLLAGCDSAVVWMASPTMHSLRNESAINTEYAEFSVFPLGDKVAYTGEPDPYMRGQQRYGATGNAFLRVYTADRAGDNRPSDGVIAEDAINSGAYHVGPVASPDGGQTLYVTRTSAGKETGGYANVDGVKLRTNRLELYVLTRRNGEWQGEPFAYNDVTHYSVGHAAFSLTGDTLYFTSDRPGGHGGTDIWYCVREPDGSWGTPADCGPQINSAGNEMFPNVGQDGVLYYSSDGFAGMGGLDVYRATGGGDAWDTPQNMRFPVNSAGDDFGYVVNFDSPEGMAGYLSSNRKGGMGNDDIYAFIQEKPRVVIMLAGTAANKETGDRLPAASIVLYGNGHEIVAKKTADGDGQFAFTLTPGQQYTVLGQKEGFHADSARVSTEGMTKSDTLHVALRLEPVFEKGRTFELENIYYDFDKYNIRRDAAAVLDELVRTLRDNPTLRIELSSHTDNRGDDRYNLRLSQQRAQSVVDYLVSRGIARDRMEAKGYGETKPVIPNARTPEEHQKNRRTEVTVLEY